jgi:transglutaminase 1
LHLTKTVFNNSLNILYRTVEPDDIAEGHFELTPRVSGEKTISAKFTSKELEDVDGFVTVTVNPSNEIIP